MLPKAGYGIPSESKENNEVHELGVLVTRIINTDVDTYSQTSGPKIWRREMRVVSRDGLFNNSKDTNDSCYPWLEDGPLPEHVGLHTEIHRWIEPWYRRTKYKNIQNTLGEKCHQQPQHHEDIYDKMWGQRFGVGFRITSDGRNMYEHTLVMSTYDFCILTVLISLQFIWILLDIQK